MRGSNGDQTGVLVHQKINRQRFYKWQSLIVRFKYNSVRVGNGLNVRIGSEWNYTPPTRVGSVSQMSCPAMYSLCAR